MKTLIIALHSKYIHSALAPWYLKAACGAECGDICVAEHTVNENIDTVLTSIYLQKPDIAAFSCYIWNISHVLMLAASLKKLLPKIVIVLGGPEVSYDAGDILEKHAFIDYVLAGEGELSFPKLIRHIGTAGCYFFETVKAEDFINEDDIKACSLELINGLAYRVRNARQVDGFAFRTKDTSQLERLSDSSNDGVISNAPTLVEVLDNIPSPYTDEMISSLKNKIVYFEASRGCPFSCSYCLSSASEGTRYFSLERVFADLDRLVAAGVRQIKFVDRTFNCHNKRAIAIIRHIIELDKRALADENDASIGNDKISRSIKTGSGGYKANEKVTGGGLNCNFHFEVGADLFDEEILQLLENSPKGLFQIEAGVQTTNEEALAAVSRKTNLGKLFTNLVRLQKSGNIHVHADLIAGLPHEDYNSFGNSFNMLYVSKPHQLQLGFLKFLKGTRLRYNAENEGYILNDFPPYEVLAGKYISYDELIVLKGVAELVERYYNSGRFEFSLEYMIENYYKSPFHFFESFYYFHKINGYMEMHAGIRDLYAIFDSFSSANMKNEGRAVLRELLRLDFLTSDNTGTLPDFMDRRSTPGFNDKCYDYLRNSNNITLFMPEAVGMPAKQLFKRVHFEQFHLGIEPTGERGSSAGKGERYVRYNPLSNTVLMFNYMSRDRVTGKYSFLKANI